MKRFKSLITFDSKIGYIHLRTLHRNYIMPYFDLISFNENARGSNFLDYTVFTFMACFLTHYIYLFWLQHCIDTYFLMLALVNVYYVYTYLS